MIKEACIYSVGACLLQLSCVVLDGERSRMNEYVDFPKSILAAMLWKDVL